MDELNEADIRFDQPKTGSSRCMYTHTTHTNVHVQVQIL